MPRQEHDATKGGKWLEKELREKVKDLGVGGGTKLIAYQYDCTLSSVEQLWSQIRHKLKIRQKANDRTV